MKYYFPLHLDGDNRGCEAIARATAELLVESKDNLVGLCTNTSLDSKLGLADYITLVAAPSNNIFKVLLRKLHRFIAPQRVKHMRFVFSQMYDKFLRNIPDDGIVLSTGGDMFCYGNNEAVYTSRKCQERGLKTILWGCSVGENNLTQEKIMCLKNFDLIYVRESLTESVLRKIGLNNVINYPDPAFCLLPKPCMLPVCFDKWKRVIGLNISNFVLANGHNSLNMLSSFIEYILKKTDYYILLIPHVLWSNQDDTIPSMHLYNLYKESNRIGVLDSKKYNYCEIRYIISKCHYFIGARTHSVISAYSTCIPAIALGYSIKSIGIAKDLGLSEKLVIDCTKHIHSNKIIESFIYLEQHDKNIREHLRLTMPIYKSRLNSLKSEVIKLLSR